jgi:hypothetical protein
MSYDSAHGLHPDTFLAEAVPEHHHADLLEGWDVADPLRAPWTISRQDYKASPY